MQLRANEWPALHHLLGGLQQHLSGAARHLWQLGSKLVMVVVYDSGLFLYAVSGVKGSLSSQCCIVLHNRCKAEKKKHSPFFVSIASCKHARLRRQAVSPAPRSSHCLITTDWYQDSLSRKAALATLSALGAGIQRPSVAPLLFDF